MVFPQEEGPESATRRGGAVGGVEEVMGLRMSRRIESCPSSRWTLKDGALWKVWETSCLLSCFDRSGAVALFRSSPGHQHLHGRYAGVGLSGNAFVPAHGLGA